MTTRTGIEHVVSVLDVLLAAGEAPKTTTGNITPSPLFLAEVDDVDTSAVLALLAVVPTEEGQSLRVFERRDGAWKEVPEYIQKFKSVSPPTVVELDRETLLAVVAQLDQSDAKGDGEKKSNPATEPVPVGNVEPYPVAEQPAGNKSAAQAPVAKPNEEASA